MIFYKLTLRLISEKFGTVQLDLLHVYQFILKVAHYHAVA